MSTYQVEPGELRASASDLRTAASSARGADAADAISALGGALPGSSTESVMPEFATAWDEGIDAWADQVDDFADGLEAAAADAEAADAAAKLFQEWLKKFLGGGS
jgi:uncharacterized protein YukE